MKSCTDAPNSRYCQTKFLYAIALQKYEAALVLSTLKHQIIYFDTCCYLRLFNPKSQERVRREAKAISYIMNQTRKYGWDWIGSDLCQREAFGVSRNQRWYKPGLKMTIHEPSKIVKSKKVANRGRRLESLGFDSADALHIACAEQGSADLLFTTDNDMLETANQHSSAIKVSVENPYEWLKGFKK